MFRASRVIPFILGACLFAHGQQAKTSVASIESLIRSREYDQALQLTRTTLQATPRDFRLWTLEGIVFSIQGKNHDALTDFDKALTISPGYPAALKGEVQVLYQAQDKRAIPLLEKILKANPNDQTAQEMLAILERKQEDCKTAIVHFHLSSELIESHPDSLEAYGDCLVRMKQLQEAVPVFERLSSLIPQQSYPKYDLAIVLVETKQDEAALKLLNGLIAAGSTDPDVLSLASEAQEAMGDTPQAVSLLRQAIVLNPTDPNYYVAFAGLCLNHSSFQVGIDMIDAGLQRIQDNPSLYISRGMLYAQLAKYDKAEEDFKTAQRLDSSQSISSYALDLAEMQSNHNDKALADTRAQLKAHPDSPYLHYTLARLLDNQVPAAGTRVSEEAIQSAKQAVKLKPDFLQARDLLATMYMRSGQYKDVIEQCRLVLRSDPSDETAIFHLIIALRRSGQGGQKSEILQLTKQLTALQQSSLERETARNRYKLVEPETAPAK